MEINIVYNEVEANGKTRRENNLETQHKIPLLSLVEVLGENSPTDYKSNHHAGLRLWVVAHARDCDGTPLYTLSFDKSICRKYEELKNQPESPRHDFLKASLKASYNGAMCCGFSEDSLKVIEVGNSAFGEDD